MKKMKLLTPLAASVALVSPLMVSLTSCGKIDYTEKISEIKDKSITTFMDLTRNTHRSPWAEGECFNYIVNKMSNLGFDNPSGQDKWSTVPEVKTQIELEKQKWRDAQIPEKSITSAFTEYGNIWYDIPASAGMERAPKIILHAHMDVSMAFSSTEEEIAWASAKKDIINVTYDRDNELLKTDKKASLGADDGLGISVMLTLAELKDSFVHGGIRLLFTAGESEGTVNYASGADFLHMDQCHEGKAWVTKKEGELTDTSYLADGSTKPFGDKDEFPYIISTSGIYKNFVYSSCGGIHQCQYSDNELSFTTKGSTSTYDDNFVPWDKEVGGKTLNLYTLKIDKLHGGQSAKYINSGYASALQMIMCMLFSSDYNCRLFSGSSAPLQYSISNTAEVTFATLMTEQELLSQISLIISTYKNAYPAENWDDFTHVLTKHPESDKLTYLYSLSPNQSRDVTKLFACDLTFGPVDWFDKEHTSVKTSCNFANLSFQVDLAGTGNSKFSVYNVCRSADSKSLNYFANISHSLLSDAFASFYTGTVEQAWTKASDHTTHNNKPVWEKLENNNMVNALTDGFKNMGITANTWDNHGWIEISCFTETYQELAWTAPQMTCLGPEIRNSHAIDEEVWTDTLNQCIGSMLYAMEKVNNYK